MKYQKIEKDQQRTLNQVNKEMRRIQVDVSLKLDMKMVDLKQDNTNEHKQLLNTVDGHIDGCNEALENQTIYLDKMSNMMNSFEQRSTKLEIENEEIEKNIANLGQNNLSRTQISKEKAGTYIDLESHLDTLTEKVNHFVQNVMVVRSLPHKVMIMQRKLAELEQKIES